MKECRLCRRVLPLTEFRKEPLGKDGYKARCKECNRKSLREEYHRDIEKTREYFRKRYAERTSSEQYRLETSEYNRNYREKNREHLSELNKQKMKNMRLEVLKRISKAHNALMVYCFKCGFTDLRALQIDHINGGGSEEIRRLKQYNYYQHLLVLHMADLKSQYQILCANCNMIKVQEERENYRWQVHAK